MILNSRLLIIAATAKEHKYMRNFLGRVVLLLVVTFAGLAGVGLTGCDYQGYQKDQSKLQGKVRDLGEAMEHCRRFMKHLLPDDVFVYVDTASSRETSEYYDIFLDLHDSSQNGDGQCRVNKKGLIIYHAIRNFSEKGRSFTSNQNHKQLSAPLAKAA